MQTPAFEKDPHAGQPVLTAGPPVETATAVCVMLHGRGASAEDILPLASELRVPGVAYLAPEAAFHSWYPYSFLEAIDRNEPFLSSALRKVGATVAMATEVGISLDRIVLLGFSQGACLASEYVGRQAANRKPYGGLVAMSGGLIGPAVHPGDYPGSLAGTPVFLGCSDIDPHIPLTRVNESAEILVDLNGQVDKRIYPGMGHTINADEILAARAIIEASVALHG